jgi:hypothetical protein
MNLFVLVAVLCTGGDDSPQCDYYALDSNLSSYECNYYFTDSGVDMVDGLITDLVTYEVKEPLTLESIECLQEDVE